ncbi:hypothetical protein ACTGVO_11540, partial [Streptococcus suis]
VFPVEVRYTSISAAYQLGGAIFGGFTPMIGVVLTSNYPGQWWPLAIFYSVLAGISFLGVLLLSYAGFAAKHGQANAAPVISAKAVATN